MAVPCCVVYDSCAQRCAHKNEQFLTVVCVPHVVLGFFFVICVGLGFFNVPHVCFWFCFLSTSQEIARKRVSEMTHYVSSGIKKTQSIQSLSLCLSPRTVCTTHTLLKTVEVFCVLLQVYILMFLLSPNAQTVFVICVCLCVHVCDFVLYCVLPS